jgi:biopolymer transport protein ExbD
MKFKNRRELPRTRIEIIPMIDTIFFLLVFFMLSSLSMTRLKGLPVDLPDAKTATNQPVSDLTLTINEHGSLFLEKAPVAWPDLQQQLLLRAGGPKANLDHVSLLVNADQRVAHGVVIRAIDIARDIGITRYGIATAAESAVPSTKPVPSLPAPDAPSSATNAPVEGQSTP